MKKSLLLILLVPTISMLAQQSATQYGQVFPDASAVQGKVVVLFGNAGEQGFLKGLSVAPKKATFICDNIDSQATKSLSAKLDGNGNYTFDATSSSWPVNETIVVCGTVTLKQLYHGDSVDTEFKFGAWGSAMAYSSLKAQVSTLQQAYVDFCPQNGSNCDTSRTHPEPELPDHTATVVGKVAIHDCNDTGEVESGQVQVVFDSTEEGRTFNHNTGMNAVCDAIPATFNDFYSSSVGDLDVDKNGNARYSLSVTFKGKNISGVVYICAQTRRRNGTIDNCDEKAAHGNVRTKRHDTFNPDATIREDFIYDYTQQ
jgi:hypothetical protein